MSKLDQVKKTELIRKSALKAYEDGGEKGTLINDILKEMEKITPDLYDITKPKIEDSAYEKNDGIQQIVLNSVLTQQVLILGANKENNIAPIIASMTSELHPEDYTNAMKNVILPSIAKLSKK